MSLLTCTGLHKTFPNGTTALRGVDLRIEPGEIRALVGANGAGKSTMIKIMSGAVVPSAGELRWKGRPVRWNSPPRRERRRCIDAAPTRRTGPDAQHRGQRVPARSRSLAQSRSRRRRFTDLADLDRPRAPRSGHVGLRARCRRASNGRYAAGARGRSRTHHHGRADCSACGPRTGPGLRRRPDARRPPAARWSTSATASTRCATSATASP